MPRQARLDYPGALHHIIGRGIDKSHIFKEDSDKEEFLRRLRALLSKSSIQCYAWCVMDNHFHLLLITGNTLLSEFMQRLLTGYAVYYNKVHKRTGHLFQNRYKSIVCDKEEYLLPLIRYIHLNPVRIKKTDFDGLRKYQWTGHKEIVEGQVGKEKVIERAEVLRYFGIKEKQAKKAYEKYIQEGLGLKEDYMGGGLIRSAGGMESAITRRKQDREMYDERILGDGAFVEEALSRIEMEEEQNKQVKSLDEIIELVSRYYRKDKSEIICSRVKEVREARDMVVYIGNRYIRENLTRIGKKLGIKEAAASIALRRARERAKREDLVKLILKRKNN